MNLNLKDLIKAVRQELIEAEDARQKAGLSGSFRLSMVQLEVQFVLEESQTGKGGFDIKVVSAGGESTTKNSSVHKVVLQYDSKQEATDTSALSAIARSAVKHAIGSVESIDPICGYPLGIEKSEFGKGILGPNSSWLPPPGK